MQDVGVLRLQARRDGCPPARLLVATVVVVIVTTLAVTIATVTVAVAVGTIAAALAAVHVRQRARNGGVHLRLHVTAAALVVRVAIL